jgi:hypothetical protein
MFRFRNRQKFCRSIVYLRVTKSAAIEIFHKNDNNNHYHCRGPKSLKPQLENLEKKYRPSLFYSLYIMHIYLPVYKTDIGDDLLLN